MGAGSTLISGSLFSAQRLAPNSTGTTRSDLNDRIKVCFITRFVVVTRRMIRRSRKADRPRDHDSFEYGCHPSIALPKNRHLRGCWEKPLASENGPCQRWRSFMKRNPARPFVVAASLIAAAVVIGADTT